MFRFSLDSKHGPIILNPIPADSLEPGLNRNAWNSLVSSALSPLRVTQRGVVEELGCAIYAMWTVARPSDGCYTGPSDITEQVDRWTIAFRGVLIVLRRDGAIDSIAWRKRK
jgi:hypothetical protein